ncbi:MAG: ribonuclease HI [Deltaproteobacteria bacterium]|nr:ribonuclease HI [Deltaproteobacteria bacterium]
MAFKGNKVWQAFEENGDPLVKNDKFLIKYQTDQDYEYWINKKSLLPLSELKKGEYKKTGKSKKTGSKREYEDYAAAELDNAICLYTDGASSGNPGPSGIGVLLRFKEHEKEISKYIGNATNNIAELKAIEAGLSVLKKKDLSVIVFTDSSYALGVLVSGWKAKKNVQLVEKIRKKISEFKNIKFIKVKGHSGMAENERADYLATSAIKKGLDQDVHFP